MTPVFAKNRARLLREELGAAGFEISHSLALELVAHQLGFADWNTLSASDGAGSAAEPHIEHETYEHTSTTMTLGDLRAIVSDHSDQTPLYVSQPTEPGSTTTGSLPAGAAVVRKLTEAGTVTWRFKADRRVPLDAVEVAVRKIVGRHNPGGWTLTSR